jgi:hypothetical protein
MLNRTMFGGGCLVFLLWTAGLLHSDRAYADEDNCDLRIMKAVKEVKVPVSQILGQLGQACYGTDTDKNSLTQEVRALISKKPSMPADLAEALALATQSARDNQTRYQPEPARQSFIKSSTNAAQRIAAQDDAFGTGSISPEQWTLSGSLGAPLQVAELSELAPAVDQACADRESAACSQAVQQAQAWIRIIVLTESTLRAYSAAYLAKLQSLSSLRLARWHAYRDDALPQFQWEWLVNSWRLTGKETRALDPVSHQPMGPRLPPTNQIILFHPGVGIEWRDAVANGSKVQSSVYLEVVGINRWSWQEDSANMIGVAGISVVATYANRDNGTRVGYGLMFHLRSVKPVALAVTKSGGDISVVLNVDLAEFVKEKMDYYKQAIDLATH